MALASLSREVLRWIQSLDLAYSVKNPKRDFANGFLVAEIFSRYYDKEIHMHSFDNGTAISRRKDNWDQLKKFFDRAELPYTPEEIQRIIYCDREATVPFINKVYTFLTQRRVQEPPKRMEDPAIPPFAKTTASQLLHNTMKSADMQEMHDSLTTEQKLKDTLDAHEANLMQERETDPERFAVVNRAPSKILRGANRTVGAEEESPQIMVKQVNVKHIDRNIASLRASKELALNRRDMSAGGASNGMGGPGSGVVGGGGGGMGGGGSGSGLGGGMGVGMGGGRITSVTEVLNAAVLLRLEGTQELEDFDPRKETITCFLDALRELQAFPDDLAASVFDTVAERAGVLSDACLASPKQFWSAVSVFCPLLATLPASTATFQSAARAFSILGEHMVAKDCDTARGLFSDFALPKLVPLMRDCAEKRHAALKSVYAYCMQEPATHIRVIKSLMEALDSMPAFLHALSILVFMEPTLDDALLDLYIYYGGIGMGMASPKLRASCIAMFGALLAHATPNGPGAAAAAAAAGEGDDSMASPETVLEACLPLLPRFEEMARDDSWWEVRAQLLVVASGFLSAFPSELGPSVARVRGIVDTLFVETAPVNIRKVGLSYLSVNLGDHPTLLRSYLEVLLSCPHPVRSALLSLARPDIPEEADAAAAAAADLTLPTGGGSAVFALSPLVQTWDALRVAQGVSTLFQHHQLQQLSPAHMLLLQAVLMSGDLSGADTQAAAGSEAGRVVASDWGDVVASTIRYLFLGMADPECCHLALPALRRVLSESPEPEAIMADRALLAALAMLYREDRSGDATCQQNVIQFLSDLSYDGPRVGSAVADLLSRFATASPASFRAYPALRDLADSVGVQL